MLEGREAKYGGLGMGPGAGEEALLARLVTSPRAAEKLGISKEQVKTIQEKLTALRKEVATLQVDLEAVSMDQARLLTATQTVDEAAVMVAIEKAGEIRTKIAKLMVQQLLTVKKVLTPEQIEKARGMRRELREENQDRSDQRPALGDNLPCTVLGIAHPAILDW
jgi:Spy/CpxP family protein refolding chaperone